MENPGEGEESSRNTHTDGQSHVVCGCGLAQLDDDLTRLGH